MSIKLSFAHLVGVILGLSFIAGFGVFILLYATTDRGTTSAIRSESATIMTAETTRCIRYGSYASISTLRRERLLSFAPVYNSVVYLPGKGCGTIVIGSPAYQAPAG